jgi:molybdopterin-dependent oxidoreductase alpha subunit
MARRDLTKTATGAELLHTTLPRRSAAGFPGVAVAIEHMARYMTPGAALRTSLAVNQTGGFDCPGCAWPDPDDGRSRLGEYCENGVKALAEEAQAQTIGAEFFAEHSVEELRQWSPMELGKAGRLVSPMYKPAGMSHYLPVAWDVAFRVVGDALRGVPNPDAAVFYTSGRTSNEAAYLYQLFVREFGTNNLPDCSNLCHESTGVALSKVLGIGKGTVKLEDFDRAELVLVIGQNPGTNHPRMLTALERCKERGGKVIAINPLAEAGLVRFVNPKRPLKMLTGGTAITDLHLPVTVNGDIALLKAIAWLLVSWDEAGQRCIDWDFVREFTLGSEEYVRALKTQRFDDLVSASAVEARRIEEAARLVAKSSRIIACWAMGITQHENGTENVQEIVNLLLLRGAIGKPGAGACPVRGHSNVQGDRTMGIWEKIKPEFAEKLSAEFGFDVPTKPGYSATEAVAAMDDGKVSVFFAMGGNFVGAMPDTEHVQTALMKCGLTVSVSTKLNATHVFCGGESLILPCLGRTDRDFTAGTEQFITTENSTGVVQMSRGVLDAPSAELKSEVAIVAGVAQATLGSRSKVDWQGLASNYDGIRDVIERTIPGFEDYNQRVLQRGGFYLPNGPRERLFTNRERRALFTINDVPKLALAPGELLLTSIRSHDQYNTTVYGLHDRYRGVFGSRHVVFMNEHDMRERNLSDKSPVQIVNEDGGQTRRLGGFVVVPYAIPRGCVAAYFPEINPVIPRGRVDKYSKTPASKSVRVRVEALT